MLRVFLSFAILALSLYATSASAISLSENGSVATLQGSIDPGDDTVFQQFLARPRAQKLTVIYLYSHGGNIQAGIGIAHQIRQAGMATAVRADSEFCDSICTVIFAGGVGRYYINGESVTEGLSGMTGLGYHAAHRNAADRRLPSIECTACAAKIAQAYRELGSPAAADLINQAPFNNFYRISGETALKLHIATSLKAPTL